MKKRTRAPAGAPAGDRRRKAAGTRAATAPTPKPRKRTGRTADKAAGDKTAGKAGKKPRAAARQAGTRAAGGAAAAERARGTIRELKAQLAEAERRIVELQALAETDFLLGILNRRGFERELNRSIAYIKRYHATGAVIMLDVDRLKPINDTFGHAAGDEVLKAVAATLAAMVRASDMVGRLGGDEFAVLLWNLSETDARAKAQALEQAIDGLRFAFGGRTVTVGASAGLAILGSHSETQRALEEADSAMYVRKAQRRHEADSPRA